MATAHFDIHKLIATTRDLQIELAPVKSDLLLLKWMIGLVLGGIILLILKTFFPM